MPQRYLVLAVMCLAELLVMIDNSIVNVALPTLARDLGADGSGLQWVVDAYTLVFAGLLLTGGYLGDRFGRRRILLTGVAGFTAVSVAAALAPSLAVLIGARAGLGGFAALVFPATLAIITVSFRDPRERATALGIWAATAGAALAIGPVVGGALLTHLSWSSVFWINLPVGVAVTAATLAWVPAGSQYAVGRFDIAGVLASIVGVSALVWSLIQGPEHGWTSSTSITGFVVAAGFLAAFVVRELTAREPILDVRLFSNRAFSAASVSIAVAFSSLFGFIFLATMYFQAVLGYSTLSAGVRLLPFAAVMAVCSPLAAAASRILRPAVIVSAGLALMSAGFFIMTTVGVDADYWPTIVVSMALVASGLALVQTAATVVIMNALPEARAGAGSAVNDTTRELGGALGVAILGSILAATYTHRVHTGLGALGLSADQQEAAGTSVVAGVSAALRLPTEQSSRVLAVVQQGFVDGMHTATMVSVLMCLAGAVFALITLWRPTTPSEVGTVTDPGPATAPHIEPAASGAR
ncbi:DHA2 family efflux MFS transporter permease subunit [Nocardia sp. NPDC055321]